MKSKMVAKMAVVTGVVTVLTITPAVFRLYSQFWCLNMFSNTENSVKTLFFRYSHYFSRNQ